MAVCACGLVSGVSADWRQVDRAVVSAAARYSDVTLFTCAKEGIAGK